MKFSLKSADMPQLAQYSGSGFSLDYSFDEKNKKLLFDLGGQFKGTNIADAKFYTDDKKLMLSVPQVYDAWFTCDSQNIEKQYNSSILSGRQKLPTNKEITLKLFDDERLLQGKELTDAIFKGYLNANADKFATLGKNIKVEKSKESKKLEIGGVSEDCTGYDVAISSQDAKDLVQGFTDYLLVDPEIKKYISRQARLSYFAENQPYKTPQEMEDAIYKQFKDGNEKFKNAFNCDDIKAVVYLDKKGRAVSLDLNTTLTSNKDKTDLKLSGDLKGKDNLGNSMDMSMDLTNNGKTVKVNLDNNITTKEDLTNQEMNLVLDGGTEPVNFKWKLNYNNKSGDFDGSLDASVKNQGVNASLAGNSKFDKSSKKLDVNFDKIVIKSNVKNSKFNITLDGSYAIAPLTNPIDEPSGEKLEVLKLDQNKLMQVMQEVQKNGSKIVSAFR